MGPRLGRVEYALHDQTVALEAARFNGATLRTRGIPRGIPRVCPGRSARLQWGHA